MTVHPLPDAPIGHGADVRARELLASMPDPDAVRRLEAHLMKLPQIDLGVTHVVHGGMCARTGLIPAGTTMTGALTNLENICVIWGDITVTTDEGVKRLTGFNVLPANAGAKRAGYAHSDTWWSTVLRTDKTDPREIEDEMTAESHALLTRREGITFAAPSAYQLED